jgi:hypothetical protein
MLSFMHVLSQPYFEKSVRMRLTFPKWELGSLSGLLKLQSSIAWVKTPHIEAFFISLQNYWSIDVENGLSWTIWTSTAQVMAKKKAESQTSNLTPDHQKSGNWPDPEACRWIATCRWKDLDESYKFALNIIPIRGLGNELWVCKVARV